MKIALLTDSHFGGKQDNLHFLEYQKKFYKDFFFPDLKKKKIDTIIHLGDVFDRRKYTNFFSLKMAKEMFFEPAKDMKVHILVGNHDCYHKGNNDTNSISLVCAEYEEKFRYYTDVPEVVDFDDLNILMIPWIAPAHYGKTIKTIESAKADVVMGHLEINGNEIMPGIVCDNGLERSLFKRFERVFTGHYHTQQDDGHIRYLGAPYEITWADWNSKKGYHIFDTETREIEFFQNPDRLFKKIYYNDKEEDMLNKDLSQYKDSYVKLIVIDKNDYYTFDRFIDRCYREGGFYEFKIIEDFSELDPNSIVDNTLGEIEDTISLLQRYVDEIDSQGLDKNKLNNLLKTLYVEANEYE